MTDSPRPVRRNNSDPESTRREILQAALEVLAEDGPESLSVTEVARRAGVNRGTAYQHFPTREDLTHATTAWVSQRIHDEFYGGFEEESAVSENFPPDLALQRLSDFAMNNPELSRAWLFDVMATKGVVTDPFWNRYVKELGEFIDSGAGRRGIDIEVYAFITLASALLWPIWAGAHDKSSRERNKIQRRFVDEMMRLVLFGALVPERHPELVERYNKPAEPS